MAAIEDQENFLNPYPQGSDDFTDANADVERATEAPDARAQRRKARATRRNRQADGFWNILTGFVWLATVSVLVIYGLIYSNPGIPLNPFKPAGLMPEPTLASAIILPTETASPTITETPKRGPATRTPTPTRTPATPTVTLTPSPTFTQTATPGPSATPTVNSPYPFILRGEPVVLAANTFPDHDECKLWVAGQTYDLNNAPMVGVIVMMGGYVSGKNLYEVSLTGTALQYGQAGYEFTVADAPANSSGTVWIQLFDQSQYPLSERVMLNTFEDCNRNLILVNFRQVR